MKLIDKNNSPIPLIYRDANIGDITFGYLHYGDSSIVEKLKSWTYVILFSMGIFIFIGFLGFSFIPVYNSNFYFLSLFFTFLYVLYNE